jgi:predicted metal-dependent phosphoesterase TrpH
MPAGQPFTALCRAAAARRSVGYADLHLHTTFSDGLYTPRQIVDLAKRSGLQAIALTDHDTLGGLADAEAAAAGSGLEIIPGVEISSNFNGREMHLLGYCCKADDPSLARALSNLAGQRAARFDEMVTRLRARGVELDAEVLPAAGAQETLGRRHLAELLVKARKAGSVREAFSRYLSDGGQVAVPKAGLPVSEAIALVRGAGGVAAWAHPSYDCTEESLRRLCDLGLRGLEAVYPTYRAGRVNELRRLAAKFTLAVTGGSDCHGPEPAGRTVGSCTISQAELDVLRQAASV